MTSFLRTVSVLMSTFMLAQAALAKQEQPQQQAVQRDDTKRTLNFVTRAEVTIDRPAKDVWPCFMDMGAWMADAHFKYVAGQPGKEGEVRLYWEKNDPAYLIEAILVAPLERYVLKVVPQQGSDLVAFAAFDFNEAGGKTKVVYDLYWTFSMAFDGSDAELHKFHDEQYEIALRGIEVNNQNLKALVERAR